MTPARSVAASVVALGLAGTLTVPTPVSAGRDPGALGAFSGLQAAERRAPALTLASASRTCDRPANYAAQSGAELLHINRLDLGVGPSSRERSATDPAVRGVGLGDVRTVLIAKGAVNSAGAARILNGKVTGSTERNEQVVQKAPPVDPKGARRRTGSKKFGPVQVGAGSLSARATWAHGMACENAGGDASTAEAGISRFTIAGGGSASLVRVPEKITSRTSTALRLRGGAAQSVSSATITAGRISLVDNEVRLRVLQAPQLRASMAAAGQSRVDYQPAVVEVSGSDGRKTRLSTAGDHVEFTLSNELRPLESLPPHLDPIGGLPLPKVSGLPVIGTPEATPVPDRGPGSTLRIALGEVRQATRDNAVAARATAIRVTLTRNVDSGAGQTSGASSGVVADLSIGVLEAAAVAPSGKVSGRSVSTAHTPSRTVTTGPGDSPSSGSTGQDGTSGDGPTGQDGTSGDGPTGQDGTSGDGRTGQGGTSGDGPTGQGDATDRGVSGITPRTAALPVTGPRVVTLLFAGLVMIIVGTAAIVLTSRRRERS